MQTLQTSQGASLGHHSLLIHGLEDVSEIVHDKGIPIKDIAEELKQFCHGPAGRTALVDTCDGIDFIHGDIATVTRLVDERRSYIGHAPLDEIVYIVA